MKKSNVIIFVLLAAASVFLLWLWFYLGFNHVDSPLDLLVSIGWWVVIVAAIFAISKVEQKRRMRIRTVYVSDGSLFNSEKGLAALAAADPVALRDELAKLIDGLEYDFTMEDFPAKDSFAPKFFVRSEEFATRRDSESEASRNASGEAAAASGGKLEVTKWTGSVYDVLKHEERSFGTPEELTGIMLTI